MSETKHTPGPWSAIQPRPELLVICTEVDGDGIAEVDELWNRDEWLANARLIAAAPELLEALVALDTLIDFEESAKDGEHSWFDDASAINAAMEKARAAIAKATGGAA